MPKNVEETVKDNHHPSSVDNMVRDDRPYEGTGTSLPPSGTNPIPGADGTLPVTKAKKTQ